MSSFEESDPTEVIQEALSPGEEPPPPPPPDEESPTDAPSDIPIPTGDEAVRVFIDGEEVTGCVQSGSVTKRLNRPWSATLRMFTHCAIGSACSKVKIYILDDLWLHGFVTQIATEAGEDGNLMSEYTVMDPMFLWQWRPARDGELGAQYDDHGTGVVGDFSNPSFFKIGLAPEIMYDILNQSINGDVPSQAEGSLFLELGDFVGGITDVSGAPTDFPMTIAEVFELLASTGVLDCVLTPIDSGGNMARIDVYNGDYGNDLTTSVVLEYETGDHNIRALRMTEDSSQVCNKLWYYLGPRVQTPRDPQGDQHWRANVTGDDSAAGGLVGPPGGDTNPAPPGGYGTHGPPGSINNPLGQRILDSREACGVRMEVRIYDAQGEENPATAPAAFRNLFRRLWQMETWLRTTPRTLVYVQPVRESENMLLPPGVVPVGVGSFDIGDLITVTAGETVRGGFTGAMRVYGFTVSWDEDGILEMGEIQTSADQEGALG